MSNLNLNDCVVIPFGFNPENPKSRKVKVLDNEMIINFDMTVDNAPECAAVAIILPDKHSSSEIIINSVFNTASGFPDILVELKKGSNKIKYYEEELKDEITLSIHEDTTEIVFTCWKSLNEGYKGEIVLTFS